MVSLAILSVMLGALIQSAGTSASNAGRLRDRAIAEWVASNRMAEFHLSPTFPATGSTKGDAEMFGITWFWKAIVQKVEDDDLRRVDIEVRRIEDDDNPVFQLAGFVSHPRLNVRNFAGTEQ